MLKKFVLSGEIAADVASILQLKKVLGTATQDELLSSTENGTLFVALLKPIMQCNVSNEHHVSVQIAFLDLLTTWVARASKLASSDDACKQQLRSQMKDHWRPVFELFFHRTAVSTATVSVGKEMFLRALQLQATLYESESVRERLEYLVRTILDYSSSEKAVYLALELISKQASVTVITHLQPDFIADRLVHMNDDTLSTPLGRLISHILRSQLQTNADEAAQIAWVDSWQATMIGGLSNEDSNMAGSIFQYILPNVFKGCLPAFKHFLKSLSSSQAPSPGTQLLVISALRMAKHEQLIPEANPATISMLGLDNELVETHIAHANPLLRIATLSLLVEHPKPTTFYTAETLSILEQYLPGFFLETDSHCRKEVLDAIRTLLGRLQASLYFTKTLLRKAKLKNADLKPIERYIEQCQSFTTWFKDLLKYNLRPGSSFQLTTVSLQVIQIASGLGWSPAGMPATVSKYAAFKKSATHNTETTMPLPFDMQLFDREMVRLIVDRLADSFDDNRTLAIGLLESLPAPIQGLSTSDDVGRIFNRAKTLMLSTRGRDGDGGARVLQFLYQKFVRIPDAAGDVLVAEVHVGTRQTQFVTQILVELDRDAARAKDDLLLVAQTAPLHGRLIALGYIISLNHVNNMKEDEQQAWSAVFTHALETCTKIWHTVKEVLCTNSPEGFLPSSIRDRSRGPYRGPETQVILSFSWRALKECSSLLQSLIAIAFAKRNPAVSLQYIKQVGDLFISWMSEIRHRGAFTAAAADFVLMCQRLESDQDGYHDMPWQWLQTSLGHLESSMHSKDITRRSGGLPMAIVSALVAEAASGHRTRLFQSALDQLVSLASSPVDEALEKNVEMELPQVHALNTLKDIFNESKLSSRTISCVERIFIVAMQGFESSIWDIRNCSLMLFNAVLNRSFRSKKPRNESLMQTFTTEAFFQSYPGLLPIIHDTLGKSVHKLLNAGHASVTTALHPILTLLSQLDVSETSEKWDNMSQTLQLVDACSTSEIWLIRSMAAQAIPTFIERSEVASVVISSLNDMDTTKQNHLHGKLLQIHALFAYNLAGPSDPGFLDQLFNDVTRALVAKFVMLTSENDCAVTKAQFLQLHLDFFTHNQSVDTFPMITRLKQMVVDYCFRSLFNTSGRSIAIVAGQGALDRVMTLILMDASAEQGFKPFKDMSAATIVKRLLEHESTEVRLAAYTAFPTLFAGKAMMRSPTVIQSLAQQSIKETWPQTATAARICLARLPASPIQSISDEQSHLSASQFDRLYEDIEASKSASPLVDASLILLGRLMQQIIKTAPLLIKFQQTLLKYSDEYMPLESRRAVLRALAASGLLELICAKHEPDLQDELLAMLPVLFGSLTDDDDDLRDEAAGVVHSLLPNTPLLRCNEMRKRLLSHCIQLYPGSSTLHYELVMLAIGLPRNHIMARGDMPVSKHARGLLEGRLKQALQPSDLLFAVERQNLWRDPVEDCKVVLEALKGVIKLDGSAGHLIAAFSKVGLDLLDDCIRQCGNDGALGWCSKADVHSIFNRVLQCAAFSLSSTGVEEERKLAIEESMYRLNHGEGGTTNGQTRLERVRLHESLRKVIAGYA